MRLEDAEPAGEAERQGMFDITEADNEDNDYDPDFIVKDEWRSEQCMMWSSFLLLCCASDSQSINVK